METRFSELDDKINGKAGKATVDGILNTVDGIAARLGADAQERAAMTHLHNRHEGWIKQFSKNAKPNSCPKFKRTPKHPLNITA